MNVPTATYRIQFNDHFGFRDLDAILDYLRELGISTIYASPVTRAFAGSQHGYDVADPLQLNPEIGTEQEFETLAAKLRGYRMDWLQDIVPNHMAYSTQNPWLYDVLERGKVSPYYSYFDLQSEPVEPLGDRIMAPFLGSSLTDCLQKGELGLQFTADDVYLVMSGEGTVGVSYNGKHLTTVPISGIPKLYTLFSGTVLQTGTLTLTMSPGVEAYDFTFG